MLMCCHQCCLILVLKINPVLKTYKQVTWSLKGLGIYLWEGLMKDAVDLHCGAVNMFPKNPGVAQPRSIRTYQCPTAGMGECSHWCNATTIRKRFIFNVHEIIIFSHASQEITLKISSQVSSILSRRILLLLYMNT